MVLSAKTRGAEMSLKLQLVPNGNQTPALSKNSTKYVFSSDELFPQTTKTIYAWYAGLIKPTQTHIFECLIPKEWHCLKRIRWCGL